MKTIEKVRKGNVSCEVHIILHIVHLFQGRQEILRQSPDLCCFYCPDIKEFSTQYIDTALIQVYWQLYIADPHHFLSICMICMMSFLPMTIT